MIELTRALARSFRTVLRHSLAEQTPRHNWPLVLCKAGDGGLTLQERRLPFDEAAAGGDQGALTVEQRRLPVIDRVEPLEDELLELVERYVGWQHAGRPQRNTRRR